MANTPKMALLSLVSVVIFLALAIFGRGGLAAFFSHPALVALAVVLLLAALVALFTEGNVSSGEREDRSNRWVLVVFTGLGFVAAYLPAYTDRIGFWVMDGEGIRWIGVVLFAAGGALRMWPVFVLGRRFSGLVAIQPGHTLVTNGVYRVIRNPSYLGLLINQIGWSLAFRSGVGLVLTVLFLPPLVARIHSEERMLRSQFGAQYDAYFQHTWRLIPGIY